MTCADPLATCSESAAQRKICDDAGEFYENNRCTKKRGTDNLSDGGLSPLITLSI